MTSPRQVPAAEVDFVVSREHRVADLWCRANGVSRRKATVVGRLPRMLSGVPRGAVVVVMQSVEYERLVRDELAARDAVVVCPHTLLVEDLPAPPDPPVIRPQ